MKSDRKRKKKHIDMDKLSLDTHHYDHHLRELYKSLRDRDLHELRQPADFESTLREILDILNSSVNDPLKEKCLSVLTIFVNDIESNRDSANDITVEDLLPRVWRFVREYELDEKMIFFEQLADVLGGRCAQGRTTRLIQFYAPHFDPVDPIYRKLLR